jgi:hydroxyethylthiazole kinase-like uncharacterized protein yjeF
VSRSSSTTVPRPPVRPKDGHKGTFGTVIVVGGCADGTSLMLGAPALSARAALRVGAGLAKLIVPREIALAALTLCPSATAATLTTRSSADYRQAFASVNLPEANAVVFGPGMGRSPATLAALKVLLAAPRSRPLGVVIDADGIHALAAMLGARVPRAGSRAGRRRPLVISPHAHIILTPHVGEFRALAAAIRPEIADALPSRRPIAVADARRSAVALQAALADLGMPCIVLLKGAATIVAGPDRVNIVSRPNPALATAGTGDVLAGAIAGLLAQSFARPDEPTRTTALAQDMAGLAAHAHADAARRWCDTAGASAGLLAMELADLLPSALEGVRRR